MPEVLLSGNHARIAKWRREQVILRTLERRPELLDKANLPPEERQLITELKERLSFSSKRGQNDYDIISQIKTKS